VVRAVQAAVVQLAVEIVAGLGQRGEHALAPGQVEDAAHVEENRLGIQVHGSSLTGPIRRRAW
jgi:hypothetical protein